MVVIPTWVDINDRATVCYLSAATFNYLNFQKQDTNWVMRFFSFFGYNCSNFFKGALLQRARGSPPVLEEPAESSAPGQRLVRPHITISSLLQCNQSALHCTHRRYSFYYSEGIDEKEPELRVGKDWVVFFYQYWYTKCPAIRMWERNYTQYT